MITRTRRPQGFQVQKRRVQDPMSYFAQNGMRIYVDGGLNGPDDPPTIDLGSYFKNMGQASLTPEAVSSYIGRQYQDGAGDPNFVYDSSNYTEDQQAAIYDGIQMFLKDRGLGGYGGESSVTPVKSEDKGLEQMKSDIAAQDRAISERDAPPSFLDNLRENLGNAADTAMGLFDGDKKPTQRTPQDQKKMEIFEKEESRFENPAYYEGADEYKGIYDNLVGAIVDKKGGDPRNVRSFANSVRYHESGKTGIDAYGSRQIVDGKEGGVGMGGYMLGVPGFELLPDGSLKRPDPKPGQEVALHPAEVAQNRYNAMAEANGWPTVKLTNEQIMDSRKISPAVQDLLFLSSTYQDPDYDFSNVTKAKKGGWSEAWLDTWWKGDDSDRSSRKSSFSEHARVFPVFAEGGVIGLTNPTNPSEEGEPTEPEKDYYASVEAKLQEMTGKPLEGMENIQGFDWQKADALSNEELGAINSLVTAVGGGTKGDSGRAISNAKDMLPEIKMQLGALEEKGIIDTPVAIKSILDEKGVTGLKRWGIEQALKLAGLL